MLVALVAVVVRVVRVVWEVVVGGWPVWVALAVLVEWVLSAVPEVARGCLAVVVPVALVALAMLALRVGLVVWEVVVAGCSEMVGPGVLVVPVVWVLLGVLGVLVVVRVCLAVVVRAVLVVLAVGRAGPVAMVGG
ncbi:hypothetical protein MULP_04512 [Mycobacterium liflandii 128FXT]|uniref:Transmembrane protein n=1 Tax=Mycobacterium liflandii (strain 128FXT) TaxID=459424 RepID=L7VBY8_MYCL1|nr:MULTISPECIES: hypothetical protein [Mycobacterium ulcerans group]AGC64060.1 hypothetical protein MULP_04512 [Mycobacterium liflandii 128FXT]